ncbi:unnamed protein product [Linum trigynum]|uniref:Uncharacterized protein n=1 Tax=Linum trigynum TaxID=586398 RepID=A0AAV2DYY2_9ROSI
MCASLAALFLVHGVGTDFTSVTNLIRLKLDLLRNVNIGQAAPPSQASREKRAQPNRVRCTTSAGTSSRARASSPLHARSKGEGAGHSSPQVERRASTTSTPTSTSMPRKTAGMSTPPSPSSAASRKRAGGTLRGHEKKSKTSTASGTGLPPSLVEPTIGEHTGQVIPPYFLSRRPLVKVPVDVPVKGAKELPDLFRWRGRIMMLWSI